MQAILCVCFPGIMENSANCYDKVGKDHGILVSDLCVKPADCKNVIYLYNFLILQSPYTKSVMCL